MAVAPSSNKFDLEKLRNDIPKYYPFLQQQAKPIWERFLEEQLADLLTVRLPTIYMDHFRQLLAAGNRQQSSPISVQNDAIPDIHQMFAKVHQEVSSCSIVASYEYKAGQVACMSVNGLWSIFSTICYPW